MECYTCDLTSICKIYEFISLQKSHADMTVNHCRIKRHNKEAVAPPPEQELKVRSAEAIATVSDRIRKLTPEPVVKETLDECPNCKQGARPTDICECKSCNKKLCIGCAVEDGPSKKFYCEECWDNI